MVSINAASAVAVGRHHRCEYSPYRREQQKS
jgi:hypothetical protein